MSDRFWNKVDRRDEDECWMWQGYKSGDGYGKYRLNGRYGPVTQAHRYAYEDLVGPIPAGLVLDHLCRNTGCVNPAHLEPVTDRENILRGHGPAAINAAKSHCDKGHELVGDNLRVRVNGHRRCRTCDREANRRRKRLRKSGTL